MSALVRVTVIYTGGTIGMAPSDPGNPASPLRPASKEALVRAVPCPLDGIDWRIVGLEDDTGVGVGPLDSSSVGPAHWLWIARMIERGYASSDGFVILHGTDTMAYTASALSFLLQNLAKPVVLTGAQLPIGVPRTDAVGNFTTALMVAGWSASGVPLVPEVTICFADRLLRGNRATKVSTSRWQGFDSPNYPVLGRFGEHIVIDVDRVRPAPDSAARPFYVDRRLDSKVITFPLYPGMRADQIGPVLALPGVDGYILQTFGSGNAPEDAAFLQAVAETTARGKIIVNVSQCVEGMVEMGRYAASSGLQAAGVISGLDMTTEAALTKLMWLLADGSGAKAAERMQIDQRGEQSENLFELRFSATASALGPLTLSAPLPAGFDGQRLKRAVIRIAGTNVGGARLALFINLPTADHTTSALLPQFAGWLDRGDTVIRDVTAALRQGTEPGGRIHLTLVATDGGAVRCEGAGLNLFATV